MPEPSDDPIPDTGVDHKRLASFSDNVISIALTLLVLDVRLPPGWHDLTLVGILRPLWPRLAAFVLSFVIVGVYWVAHHMILGRFRSATKTVLWANNLFLLLVTLVPASAGLIGGYPGSGAAEVLYGLDLAGVAATLLLVQRLADRHHATIGRPFARHAVRQGCRRSLAGMMVGLVGAAVAAVAPHLSYAVFWLTPAVFVLLQSKPDEPPAAPPPPPPPPRSP